MKKIFMYLISRPIARMSIVIVALLVAMCVCLYQVTIDPQLHVDRVECFRLMAWIALVVVGGLSFILTIDFKDYKEGR